MRQARSGPSPDPPSRVVSRRSGQTSLARGWRPGPKVTQPSELQVLEHLQPVSQESGHEETLADRFLAGAAEPLPESGVKKDLERSLRALLDARDEEPGLAV